MARRSNNVMPFRRRPRRWTRAGDYGVKSPTPRRRKLTPITFALPLAAATAVFLWDGSDRAEGYVTPKPVAIEAEAERFPLCDGPVRDNCVVDGDTFWYRGEKVRIADINTPEISAPACPAEARLGAAASERLAELLNAGPFTLERDPFGDDRDRYGRLLRTVSRDGESLGAVLVAEGLAEEWQGYRRSWC